MRFLSPYESYENVPGMFFFCKRNERSRIYKFGTFYSMNVSVKVATCILFIFFLRKSEVVRGEGFGNLGSVLEREAINVQMYARALDVGHELHWLFMGLSFYNYMHYVY